MKLATGTAVDPGIARPFADVFGDRLVSLVAYGSAATGGVIPGFSDLDVALFLDGPFSLRDAEALNCALRGRDWRPFAYLQIGHTYDLRRDAPHPAFVPGATAVLAGGPMPAGFEHTAESLAAASQATVRDLGGRLAKIAAEWAEAAVAGREQRAVRVLACELKPVLRALAVLRGVPPLSAWAMDWAALADHWREWNPPAGKALGNVLAALPPSPAEALATGEVLLRLIALAAADTGR